MIKTAIDLKIQLLKKGIRQKDIALKAGVHKSLVSNVIAGRMKSDKVDKVIQEMLGGEK
jgi:predicted XRE-type DNA-binding protein